MQNACWEGCQVGEHQLQAAARSAQQIRTLPDSEYRQVGIILATDEAGKRRMSRWTHLDTTLFTEIRAVDELQGVSTGILH